jgi:L-ascorbate metabolism protein UlaG (beta-lactamase superfamily)
MIPKEHIRYIKKADFILITHDHFDHFSEEDINLIALDKTKIILPEYMKNKNLLGIEKNHNIIFITTHETHRFYPNNHDGELKISTIPAYNIDKSFHNKDTGVGFIIDLKEKNKEYTLYHAGDTDLTPEMKILKGIDYAMIPVGGTYTMNPKEASEFITIAKPKNIIPMHYGNTIGIELDKDITIIKETCKKNNINLQIMEKNSNLDIF